MKILMKVNIKYGNLHVRKGPSKKYGVVNKLTKGQTIIVTEQSNGWYKHDHGGWSYGGYLQILRNLETNPSLSNNTNTNNNTTNNNKNNVVPELPPLTEYESSVLASIKNNANIATVEIDDMQYVYGTPFRFNDICDPPPSENCSLGRTYIETMLADMSMLVLTPGKADFMKDFGKRASNAALRNLLKDGGDDNSNEAQSLKNALEGKTMGRYYTFASCYTEYMKYVNNLCRVSAIYLGIGDEQLYPGSKKFKDFNWDIGNFNSDTGLFNFLTEDKCVAFYIDANNSSFSDGMSNGTDQSMLAGLIQSGSDVAKEIRFLTGKSFSEKSTLESNTNNLSAAVEKIIGGISNKIPGKFGQRVADYGATIVNGGQIIFPEIPKDSSYNKSTNITMKFSSPYGDIVSIYQYCLVPVWHLVALAYPRQLGPNGYLHPFLVRGFCKGYFNCSMGIIDSITINKCESSSWTIDGLPSEVVVNISIKDLYNNLTIPKTGDMSTFYNVEFLDMLAMWCGVNINKPELSRKLNLIVPFLSNSVTEYFPNIGKATLETIRNNITNFLR